MCTRLTTRPPAKPSAPRYLAPEPQKVRISPAGLLGPACSGSTKVARTDRTIGPPQPLVMFAVPRPGSPPVRGDGLPADPHSGDRTHRNRAPIRQNDVDLGPVRLPAVVPP